MIQQSMSPRFKIGVIEEDTNYRHELVLNISRHTDLSVCLHTATTTAAQSFLQQQPHLLLLGMPPGTQQQIDDIKVLKSLQPAMLIVVMTADEDPQVIQQAFDKGADGYILKTDLFHNITRKLVHMLEYDQPVVSQQLFRYLLYRNKGEKPIPQTNLTKKEKEITDLVLEGLPYKSIAAKLNLSLNTIQYHMKNIFYKLGIKTKSELFKMFYQ
ncbi:LuxR C-terminal-related transcriptional regulator [Chitinophaga sp. LS1]|uniref:LuxR C-terminal-related transcriptional regulator n=1 Tax=Chitinophaga sp. LS1 TaxID=3051176 RepID=UPI002AAADB80|nr:LuxR C-terminal-related transcriptional regulator [Chitinophaga sp. LS1]WPV64745.1 LuxR C-terminal-related transcriptional regulator [Chitinophaga sp. LS1]